MNARTHAAVAHLLAGHHAIASPGTTRDRHGRIARHAGGEYDWLRELTETERKAFASDLLTGDPSASGPDVIASMVGLDVDSWADELLRCWRGARTSWLDEEAEARAAEVASERPLVVGKPEIADRLGVKRPTVYQWHNRGLLPAADLTVGGVDAWYWSTIEDWAVETGRL